MFWWWNDKKVVKMDPFVIKVKRIYPTVMFPERDESDSFWQVRLYLDKSDKTITNEVGQKGIVLEPGKTLYLKTGLNLIPPEGYYFKVIDTPALSRLGIKTFGVTYTGKGQLFIPIVNTGPTSARFVMLNNDLLAGLVLLPKISAELIY